MTDETYKCAFCGKQHVKLWRPYNCVEPLICAVCAEKRLTTKYEFETNTSYPITTCFNISLIDISEEVTMIPAAPNENGGYWPYNAVPEDLCNWWKELPTK